MEEKDKKEKVIKLGVNYLRSRTLDGVLKTYLPQMSREEIHKQWEAANKK